MLEYRNLGILEDDDLTTESADSLSKQLPAELNKAANSLFSQRADIRRTKYMLQKALEDGMGLSGIDNVYQNKEVREVRDMIRELDQSMGETANAMERIASKIKKGTLK